MVARFDAHLESSEDRLEERAEVDQRSGGPSFEQGELCLDQTAFGNVALCCIYQFSFLFSTRSAESTTFTSSSKIYSR